MPSSETFTTVDFSHALYLHPSDTPGALLVSHQLTGVENYNVWSRSMRIALLAKSKLGLIDGSFRRASFTGALESQWDRCNAIVLSWILNAVSQELSAGVVFASSAALVWDDLKERFDKVGGSRIFFLHREITTLVQGESSISAYFTKLKLLWSEYNALVPFSTCDCEASQENQDQLLQQRLFQFLMGLNETYTAVRSQLLLMKPLPTVNQAYSMLVQEESNRFHLSGITPLADTTVMYSQSGSSSSSRRRFNGVCAHCGVKGHKKETCYRLVGFPSDFHFTKRKEPQAAMATSGDLSEDATPPVFAPHAVSSVAPSVTTFSQEQYNQILALLQKAPAESAVNAAGTLH